MAGTEAGSGAAPRAPFTDFEQQLVGQVVAYDSGLEQTAPGVVRTILAAGRHAEFLAALRATQDARDRDVDAVCARENAVFVRMLDELVALRARTSALRTALTTVSAGVEAIGSRVCDARTELWDGSRALHATHAAVDAMRDALAALNLGQHAVLHAADKDYPQAARLLLRLAGTALPRLEVLTGMGGGRRLTLAARLRAWLPGEFGRLRELAMRDAADWLEEVRRAHASIGEAAFERAQRRLGPAFDPLGSMSADDALDWAAALAHAQRVARADGGDAATAVDAAEVERADAEAVAAHIDWRGLLRAAHLFALLDARDAFAARVAEDRRAQAGVVIHASVPRESGTRAQAAASLAAWMHAVAGFFVAEWALASRPQRVYAPTHLDALWAEAVAAVRARAAAAVEGACAAPTGRAGAAPRAFAAASFDREAAARAVMLVVLFLRALAPYAAFATDAVADAITDLLYRVTDAVRVDAVRRLSDGALVADLRPAPPTAEGISSAVHSFPWLAAADAFGLSHFVLDVRAEVADARRMLAALLRCVAAGAPDISGADVAAAATAALGAVVADAAAALADRLSDASLDAALQILADLHALRWSVQPESAPSARASPAAGRIDSFVAAAERRVAASLAAIVDASFCADRLDLGAGHAGGKEAPEPSTAARQVAGTLEATRLRLAHTLPPAAAQAAALRAAQALLARVASVLGDAIFGAAPPALPLAFFGRMAADTAAIVRCALENEATSASACLLDEVRQIADLALSPDVHVYMNAEAVSRRFPALRNGRVIAALSKIREPAEKKREIEDLVLLLR